MIKTLIVIIFSIATVLPQDNLLTLLDEKDSDESYPVQGTFKATRIVNAQSIELPRKGTMEFIMFHRFGSMTNGRQFVAIIFGTTRMVQLSFAKN